MYVSSFLKNTWAFSEIPIVYQPGHNIIRSHVEHVVRKVAEYTVPGETNHLTYRDKSSHLQRHIISTILLMLVITEETWNASWRFVFFSSKLYTILISFMYFEIGQTYDIHESGDKIITCPLYRAITCRVVLAHLLQAMTCMPASYW